MFTVKIVEVEAHSNGRYTNNIRTYSHKSPKVAYERATGWGWWRWCSVRQTGFQTEYAGSPIAQQVAFYNNNRLTSSSWDF